MVRNNVSICPVCGENLKPYDKILRIACTKGRKILWNGGCKKILKHSREQMNDARERCAGRKPARVLRRKPRPEKRDGEIGLLGSVCRVHSCAKKRVNIRLRRTNFARMYGSDGAFFCFFMQYHTIERFSKEKYVKIVY